MVRRYFKWPRMSQWGPKGSSRELRSDFATGQQEKGPPAALLEGGTLITSFLPFSVWRYKVQKERWRHAL